MPAQFHELLERTGATYLLVFGLLLLGVAAFTLRPAASASRKNEPDREAGGQPGDRKTREASQR